MKTFFKPDLKASILSALICLMGACNHFRPCVNLKQFTKFFTMDLIGEPYGATDINAITGNQRLSVAVNQKGTITVFKWPNPSFYDQVAYMTTRREKPNLGALPDEGIFAGIYFETTSEKGFFWLRDFVVEQKYLGPRSVAIKTRYQEPHLGIEIEQIDLVEPKADVFWRNFQVRKFPSSKILRAEIISYVHFAPKVSKLSRLPLTDWCLDPVGDSVLSFDQENDLFLQKKQGLDLSTKKTSSITLAFGFSEPSIKHWTRDDFHFLPVHSFCTRKLSALSTELNFNEENKAQASFIISAGINETQALNLINSARKKGFEQALAETENHWQELLKKVPLPHTENERIKELSLRSVIVLLLGFCKDTGAMVASISTQPPYGEDWQRDGAYLNEALLSAGFAELVKQHNLFYLRTQSQPGHKLPMVPEGNWASNYFADGVPGFPILWWELDETGFALWTLWRYYEFSQDREYLEEVYPAVKRSADFLVKFRNPKTGLTRKAYESDEVQKLSSFRGALSAYLGLTYALKAGEAMKDERSLIQWRARKQELEKLIWERYYDPKCQHFVRFEKLLGNCEQGSTGWEHSIVLWPANLISFSEPRAEIIAEKVWAQLEPSFLNQRQSGLYEMYGLLSLAKFGREKPELRERLRQALIWCATVPLTETGLFGEIWLRIGDQVYAGQSQPQLWHHALFYLTALELFPEE